MTFEEIFTAAPIGAVVRVSDGQPKPPDGATLRLNIWRSHNCEGRIMDKEAATETRARRILVEGLSVAGVSVSYWIDELTPHTFTLIG